MFNPYVRFHFKMISGLREMNRRYLVSQVNRHAGRSFGDDAKEPILLTDYDDMGLARIHFNALTDKYRAILDLEKEHHRLKIAEMLQPGSRYRLFAAFIDDIKQLEKKMNDKYSRQMRNYIMQHTNWRIGADKILAPKMQLIFGELFVILKYSGQEIRFKLADLDRY